MLHQENAAIFHVEPAEEPAEAQPARILSQKLLQTADVKVVRFRFAAGEEQTRDQAEELLTATTARVAAGLDTLLSHAGETARRRDAEALAAAVRLVEKLFPALAERETMREIETLLSDALSRLHEEPRVVVRVADPLLDPLRARTDAIAAKAGYPGQIILLADDAIAEGDVRVEWADGGAERDTERLWRDVRDMLAQATGSQTPGRHPDSAGDAKPVEEQAHRRSA